MLLEFDETFDVKFYEKVYSRKFIFKLKKTDKITLEYMVLWGQTFIMNALQSEQKIAQIESVMRIVYLCVFPYSQKD